MRRPTRTVAAVLAWTGAALTWLYPLLVAAQFGETCTQCGDDGYVFPPLYLTVLAATALPLLVASAFGQGARRPVRWTVPAALLVPLVLVLPHAYSTTVLGHHVCGPAYDSCYVEVPEDSHRWHYPVQWGLALLVSGTAVLPWARERRRPRPSPQGAV